MDVAIDSILAIDVPDTRTICHSLICFLSDFGVDHWTHKKPSKSVYGNNSMK